MSNFKYSLVAVTALFVAPMEIAAQGDQTAISLDTSKFWNLARGPGVFGWQFSPQSDIRVTRLGVYDNAGITEGGFPGDGLLESHAIGIWDNSSPATPLLAANIPLGTEASLENGFRFVTVNPITLNAGRDYVIGAAYGDVLVTLGDLVVGEYNNPVFQIELGSEVAFVGRRYVASFSGELDFPGNSEPGVLSDFGPNFTYTAVPEPAPIILVLAGFTAFSAFAKARHQSALTHVGPRSVRS